jgi:hypothetical protein
MAARTQNCTREYLGTIPLPNHADTYTVISHEFVISNTLEQLALHGFTVADEKYRANSDGSVAQGIYYLNYTKDPEVGMMFAWSNSYNKTMRFKCGIGGYVFICMNGVVAGDMGSYSRRHSGSADADTIKTIIDQISNADEYFTQIVTDKEIMKNIILTERKQAELLGILYAEYEILTNEQISVVKNQMEKPSYDYNCDFNSLWAFYNHVTYALKKSHPKDWMEDQRKLHWFMAMEFDFVNYSFTEEVELDLVDPLELNYGEPENQLNILNEIQKLEETEDEYTVTEDTDPTWIEDEVILYEDLVGNTFEAPVVEDITSYMESGPIESDEEFKVRLDEPELIIPTFDEIVFEGLKAADEAKVEKEEKTIDASDLIGTYTLDEMPALIEKIQDKIDEIQEPVKAEEVKPTTVFDDFDFDLSDDKKDDTLGGEFFL